MEQQEIDKKLEEREQLAQQMQQLQQQQRGIGDTITRISARMLNLEGWIECAFTGLDIKSIDEYEQLKKKNGTKDIVNKGKQKG